MKFSKTLSRSEAKYKYIGLPKQLRAEEFPDKDVLFDVKFQGKKYQMSVNNKNCIMLTKLYDQHEFQEDETLTIKSVKKSFEFSIE